jgi:hypothetical protein
MKMATIHLGDVKKVNMHPTLGHLWSQGYEPVRNILKEQAKTGTAVVPGLGV